MTELNDTFPKTGRVNEVCKEWLVREDGALAQQLQSQEINDHYKGNRFRNQVVRQDFPTALQEQHKEKENAERQAALYHQMINEQEEADAKVARKLAEKLRRDQDLERRRLVNESEMLAKQLETELLVGNVINEIPIPPRKSGKKFTETDILQHTPPKDCGKPLPVATPPQLQSKSNNGLPLNYVSLQLNEPRLPPPSRGRPYPFVVQPSSATQYTQIIPTQIPPTRSHYDRLILTSHTPEKSLTSPDHRYEIVDDYRLDGRDICDSIISPGKESSAVRRLNMISNESNLLVNQPAQTYPEPKTYSIDFSQKQPQIIKHNKPPQPLPIDVGMGSHEPVDPLIMSKLTDSLKHHQQLQQGATSKHLNAINDLSMNGNFEKLSPEKFDFLMGNAKEPINVADNRVMRPSVQKSDNTDSIDRIERDNTDRIELLQQLGMPNDEIMELDRRMRQEERDEELARLLQEQERGSLTLEEKDRLLAMETQDKEFAKMLQDRERAKAKRAKERARLKRQQLANESGQSNSNNPEPIQNSTQYQEDSSTFDGSYSDPVDLLTNHTDANRMNTSSYSTGSSREYSHQKDLSHSSVDSYTGQNQDIPEENYSNPVDLIQSTGHPINMNVSVNIRKQQPTRLKRDDDIYTSPADATGNKVPLRPNNLEIRGPLNRPAPPRAHLPSDSLMDNIALTNDSTYPMPITPTNQKSHDSFDMTSTSPVPPYMPIQGMRRNIAVDNKKKKSKDKCTHQ